MNLLFQALYYFLPAAVANMTPPLIHKLFREAAAPIDHGYLWRGKPFFGSHKTWRGLIAGILMGVFAFNVQVILYSFPFFQTLSIVDYSHTGFFLGFLLSSGALAGDLVKSFFKRRLQIPSGTSWVPFDQIDFVVGALLFSFLVFIPPVSVVVIILLTYPFFHPLINTIGYYLHVRDVKM